jgi:hypothetical protein
MELWEVLQQVLQGQALAVLEGLLELIKGALEVHRLLVS